MNANEKRSNLEDIKLASQSRELSAREYHEAIQLCEDLGLERAGQLFKREFEYRIQRAKESAKLGIPRCDTNY